MDLQILRERYEKYELERVFEALKGHARNAIEISLQKCADEQIPLGASKFGGLPDLPQGEPWPVNEQTGAPLHFIAQINFKQTAEFDTDGELPSHGMLYLFYDCVQIRGATIRSTMRAKRCSISRARWGAGPRLLDRIRCLSPLR